MKDSRRNSHAETVSDGRSEQAIHDSIADKLLRMWSDHDRRWQGCRMSVCRRRHACSAPTRPCLDNVPVPQPRKSISEQEQLKASVRARVLASMPNDEDDRRAARGDLR